MRIIIFILCCASGIYGENNTTLSVQERSTTIVTFNVSIIKNNARCKTTKKELILEEGRTVKLNAYRINIPKEPIENNNNNQQKETTDVQKVNCTYNKNGSGQYELGEEYDKRETNGPWEQEHTITKDMYGVWSCKLKYNENAIFGDINPIEQHDAERYSYVICKITVKKPDLSTTPVPPGSDKQTYPINTQICSIIAIVGIVVLLIIVGQTIALCYFKRKAQPPRRMDTMTAPRQFDRNDRARYSAPPCKKSSAIAEEDRDSHIYEMVGVNALYNKSSDLEPGGNTDTAEKNIRDRPPLPLPHEIPKPVLAETLPLNKPSPMTSTQSTMSTNLGSTLSKKGKELPPPPGQGFKKAPARPPKQIDENSIPGSLRRTAKPTASPAAVSASAKTGTLPKATSTESPVSELKNIFKKRNAVNGNKTPTPSPAATLERKEPPKVEAKPSTLTKPQTQKQPPKAKPIVNQQSQIKLILPKIEASLKTPKPLVPKAVEPTVPIKSPPPPIKAKKPLQVVPVTPKPVPQKPVKPTPKPVQKRPLLTPESVIKLPPEPISPHPVPVPSLPLIYQTADDDSTPGTDDDYDEEWTYEQLGQYNIYNL